MRIDNTSNNWSTMTNPGTEVKYNNRRIYPGSISIVDEDPIRNGNDNIAKVSVKRQGINSRRQLSGWTNRRRNIVNFVHDELIDEEFLPWWSEYDY